MYSVFSVALCDDMHARNKHDLPSRETASLYTLHFSIGNIVKLKCTWLPIIKFRPFRVITYRNWSSHCRSTTIECVSSVSSPTGAATRVTSLVATSFEVRAPGRCTTALRRYITTPKSHRTVGGDVDGIANETGYVYVPGELDVQIRGCFRKNGINGSPLRNSFQFSM